MSYFEALAAGAFKNDGEGRPLFFPWGAIGAGYVIRSEADRARVHGALVRMHQAAHLAAVPLVLLAPLWLPFALLPPSLLAYAAWVNRRTAGWERSAERLSLAESLDIQARLLQRWVLWLFLAASLAFTAGAAHMLATDPEQRLVAGVNLLVSGACIVFAWRMLRAARPRR
jgi:hypothetical protein